MQDVCAAIRGSMSAEHFHSNCATATLPRLPLVAARATLAFIARPMPMAQRWHESRPIAFQARFMHGSDTPQSHPFVRSANQHWRQTGSIQAPRAAVLVRRAETDGIRRRRPGNSGWRRRNSRRLASRANTNRRIGSDDHVMRLHCFTGAGELCVRGRRIGWERWRWRCFSDSSSCTRRVKSKTHTRQCETGDPQLHDLAEHDCSKEPAAFLRSSKLRFGDSHRQCGSIEEANNRSLAVTSCRPTLLLLHSRSVGSGRRQHRLDQN